MKKQVLIFIFLASSFIGRTQTLGYDGFFHLLDLYFDEQYEVVAIKLKNMGFEVVKSTPDYEIDGVRYKGDFRMEKSRPHPFKFNRDMGITVDSHWEFKTKDHPSYIEVEIDFEFEDSYVLFNSIFNRWKEMYGEPDDVYCLNNENCGLFMNYEEVYGKDVEDGSVFKLQPRGRLFIRYDEYPVRGTDDKIRKIKGSLGFRLVKYPIETTPDEYFEKTRQEGIVTVPLKKQNGVLHIPLRIGGKELLYIVDSGASDISLNKSSEKYLIDIGVIRPSDYLKDQSYQLADGSVVTYKRVKLSSVKIADVMVYDVVASIVNDGDPLLLGQSFLQQFSHWQIDNQNQILNMRLGK